MKIKLIIRILFVLAIQGYFAPVLGKGRLQDETHKDITLLKQRLMEKYQAEPLDTFQIRQLALTMRADGSWPDIDYESISAGFPAEVHLLHLKAMAMAYSRKGSNWYLNKNLKEKICSGFEFYLSKKPRSSNWWYNDIGGPQIYMITLLLIKDNLEHKLLIRFSSYLKDATDNPSHKGMNRIWVSAITIHKGCIENNYSMIWKGFQSVSSTLEIAREQGMEGIKIDNSFHQHRPQLYSGGYGMAFAEQSAALIVLSANTSFSKAFSEDKKQLFSGLLLHGHQLFSYRNAIDFGTIGRNIARPRAIHAISAETLDQMALIDPSHAEAFYNWKFHLDGSIFPLHFQGNKYFWKSDIMTQHGADYYLSAKVISTRTAGTEMLNGENLKGYNLPLGATNIMTTGEEYNAIFPVWDWTRVPGTTAVMNQSASSLPWYLFGTNEFAGGVSNGTKGAIAYEHSYNGVQAKKAYFFADDFMFCMGTGITALRTQPVITSVNQCYLKGDVIVGNNQRTEGQTFTDTLKTFNERKMNWVYHQGVGYIFPAKGDITLKVAAQSGSWKAINNSGSEDPIRQPVFSIWFNHGTAPKDDTYCYLVAPEKSLQRFKEKVSTHGFEIRINDKKLQAVKYRKSYFLIFYQPGTADLGNGLSISSDARAIVMFEAKNEGYEVSVADPVHEQKQINLSLRQSSGRRATSPPNNPLRMHFTLPDKDYAGSTLTKFYKYTRSKNH